MTQAEETMMRSEGGLSYDGFISYSHAADDLLAPRLQSALQRFAKPWWKRRAVRIFRDESSLSANPHLWSSITEALDTSGWFVLLLSPDAASSDWVNQEIAYWVEKRDPKKILPVVTDGEFGWSGSGVEGDTVPESLQGVFSEEPRWVDVRWAKDEDQLDLKDPRFADAVADIASTIRGVPKDDLASEEVRQHRRTVRTAWAAGGLVTTLAVVAVVAGIFAIGQRNDARDSQVLAEQEAARANQEADRANTETERADEEAERASLSAEEAARNARLARARELAASAVSVRDDDPELATLLAIEAIHQGGAGEDAFFAEGLISLREALDSNRLVDRMVYPAGGEVDVAFTPDGAALIVTSMLDRSVAIFDVDDLAVPQWTFRDLTTSDRFVKSAVHPDGSEVAVVVVDDPIPGDLGPEVVVDETGQDAFPGRIIFLDLTRGGHARTLEIDGCVEPGGFDTTANNQSGYSPSGGWFVLSVTGTDCAAEPGFLDSIIYQTDTWQEVRRLGESQGLQEGYVSFTADGARALVQFPFVRSELRSFPDFELLKTIEIGLRDAPHPWMGRISPDGSFVFFSYRLFGDSRPGFWDIDRDMFMGWGDRHQGIAIDAAFSSDGSALVFGSDSDSFHDPGTGLVRFNLHTSGTHSVAVSPKGSLAATGSEDGVVELWALSGETTALLTEPDGTGVSWIQPNEIIEGERVAIRAYGNPGEGVYVVEPATGRVENRRFFVGPADVLPDGRFVVAGSREPAGTDENPDAVRWGPLVVWDPADDSVEMIRDCVLDDLESDISAPVGRLCPDGDPLFVEAVRVSSDGTQFAAASPEGLIRVWETATLEVVRTVTPEVGLGLFLFGDDWFLTGVDFWGYEASGEVLYIIDAETGEVRSELEGNWRWHTRALSHDGKRLYLMDQGGRAFEFDTSTWELLREWPAMQSKPRGISISEDDTRLALSGEDGFIVIWDIESAEPVLLDRIPTAADTVSDIVWIGDDRMGAALMADAFTGAWQVIDLSAEAVVESAVQGLVRGFTPDECATYLIDPCPTLDEMRSR